MPTLEFKGKQHIYAHHLTVPYRPLVPHPEKSVGTSSGDAPSADDNLIIHGDNLHALKALLPRYAGRIKCIYIDPPYNTGNENWLYNDNVNSPLHQEWLRQISPIDGEDLERHDKWLCMMWPRLHLLKDLMSDDGVIFVSIDDNEYHHLRAITDEIFGESNFLNCFAYISNLKGRQIAKSGAARTHEYVLAYAKNVEEIGGWQISARNATALMPDAYRIPDYEVLHDDKGAYVVKNELHNTNSAFNEITRPNLVFNIHYHPGTQEVRFTDVNSSERHKGFHIVQPKPCNDGVHRFHAWRWGKDRIRTDSSELFFKRTDAGYRIFTKIRDFEFTNLKDLLTNIGSGGIVLRQLGIAFPNPKPVDLLKLLIGTSLPANSVVLDSFAGSGTTAHAVLALNKEDGGDRKFILVECEDYANDVTAERVRRVMKGVSSARGKALQDGLGGSFTFCTLGEPMDIEGMLTGEALPAFASLAAYLLHTASGVSAGENELQPQDGDGLFHASDTLDYYLLYKPDLEYLRSDAAILNEERAGRISAASRERGKKAIVFGTGKYIGQRELTDWGITFVQLPYQMHRTE